MGKTFVLLVVFFGVGSCKSSSQAMRHESETEPSMEIAEVEKAPAPAQQMSGRYTREEIDRVLVTLKACVDESTELAHISACGCRSDLLLSKKTPPEDPGAHCADLASKMVALSELPQAAQLGKDFLLAAKDVPAPGSAGLFAFAAPCLIKAVKKKSKEHYAHCACITHELANRLVQETIKTNEDFVKTMGRVAPDLQANTTCK